MPAVLGSPAPRNGAADARLERGTGPVPLGRRHILTVALEDYFHTAPHDTVIRRSHWSRLEMRLEQSTRRTLDLLDQHQVRATFFVLGWVAEAVPELVRDVVARGHEVASKGFQPLSLQQAGPERFREDAFRAREALERATGRRVLGYRMPRGWLAAEDLWALEILAAVGYAYDSSVRLVLRSFPDEPWRRFSHWLRVAGRPFLEVPLSSIGAFGTYVPIAGGNYFRQFPDALMRRAVAHWDRHCPAPYVMYFHTWELDPEQPRINGAPVVQRLRQYRNLDTMSAKLGQYLSTYRFTSVADYFGFDQPPIAARRAPARWMRFPLPVRAAAAGAAQPGHGAADSAAALPVTVVIPCYNEEQTLGYLANTLRSVVAHLGDRYRFTFLFVDDCSTDGTWDELQRVFGDRPDCRFVRHERNEGVAAAIRTGLVHAETEVVCSIDCDCTYDPHELGEMIPLLEPGVDLVTASPYHPAGGVRNVPPWRLVLSRGLSVIYRTILRQRLATYTSCFRVYRRSAALAVDVRRPGFLGVAELAGRLDLAGHRVAEFPTTLEARLLGRSKMKVVRTVVGHLGLVADLATARLVDGLRSRRNGRP